MQNDSHTQTRRREFAEDEEQGFASALFALAGAHWHLTLLNLVSFGFIGCSPWMRMPCTAGLRVVARRYRLCRASVDWGAGWSK